jgi:uncharacterized protein YyaL (SSP411 family)
MAHESFEDPEVARLLNESFISIKVDREERPEVDQILGRFTDAEQGGFFAAPADHGSLIVRKKDMIDSSVPSGGGLATMDLLRLAKLCGRSQYLATAEAALRAFAPLMEKIPFGAGQMLAALDVHLDPTPEIAILGSPDQAANAELLASLTPLATGSVQMRGPQGR